MNNKSSLIVLFFLGISLLFAGCGDEGLPEPTLTQHPSDTGPIPDPGRIDPPLDVMDDDIRMDDDIEVEDTRPEDVDAADGDETSDDGGDTEDTQDTESETSSCPDNAECDDGNACTENDRCVEGECLGDPVECPGDGPCKVGQCDPATGCTIIEAEHGTPCNDGNLCTAEDICDGGICTGTPAVCDDGDVCTTDHCSSESGCVYTFNGGGCDDGNACTAADFCTLADDGFTTGCVGTPLVIDDSNPCTADACVDGVVMNSPLTGTPCPTPAGCDSSICTGGACVASCGCTSNDDCEQPEDLCLPMQVCNVEDGTCSPDPSGGVVCEASENPCLENTCNPSTGACVTTPAPTGTPCSDGSACTELDACILGECLGFTVECEDGNACTNNVCDPLSGCMFPALSCDDSNACTTDACNSIDGCINLPVNCDDGDACNGVEGCNPETGCVDAPDLECDDSNACTVDACDEVEGCSNTPITCFDVDFCNGVESCHPVTGCLPGTPVSCNDGNACTEDSCNEELDTCTNTYIGDSCDDGDVCNGIESCNPETGCVYPPDLVCQDDNPCTENLCDPATGCVYPEDEEVCSDGDLCNGIEVCDPALGCLPGSVVECDDENPCTADSCAEGECLYENLSGISCDSDDVCSISHMCVEGACEGVPIIFGEMWSDGDYELDPVWENPSGEEPFLLTDGGILDMVSGPPPGSGFLLKSFIVTGTCGEAVTETTAFEIRVRINNTTLNSGDCTGNCTGAFPLVVVLNGHDALGATRRIRIGLNYNSIPVGDGPLDALEYMIRDDSLTQGVWTTRSYTLQAYHPDMVTLEWIILEVPPVPGTDLEIDELFVIE